MVAEKPRKLRDFHENSSCALSIFSLRCISVLHLRDTEDSHAQIRRGAQGSVESSMMNSSDERGEAPVSTPRESAPSRHAPLLLAALDALLKTAHDPFAVVFKTLRDVLAFDRALV